MSIYNIQGDVIKAGKEVWVDDYSSIDAAILDGDIINFTSGKTYEIANSIDINKACYLKGNGCVFHADPIEGKIMYLFNVKHSDVVIENFNAESEDMYAWYNGGVTYPNTITSNIYFSRISASNIRISDISTNHLCGAVRVADDYNSESFSYSDVSIENIVCLDGVINVYIGNVVRCTANNLMLSTNVHNDTLGHAIYISRGVKHVSVSNFTIYNNYGQYGGISIHPSSSTDPNLTSYISISNGTIRSIADGSFAFQITHCQFVTISNVILESSNGAKAVSISRKANNIVFNNCFLKADNTVARCAVWEDQRQIYFNGCTFKCMVKSNGFDVLQDIQGIVFTSCVFEVRKDTSLTAPKGYLLSTHPISTSQNCRVSFYGCAVKVFDDIELKLLRSDLSMKMYIDVMNTVFDSNQNTDYLIDTSVMSGSIVNTHNVTLRNYDGIVLHDASGTYIGKVFVDGGDYKPSDTSFEIPSNESCKMSIVGKHPNMIVLKSSNGLSSIAVATYDTAGVTYINEGIQGITVSKDADSYTLTVSNSSSYSVSLVLII